MSLLRLDPNDTVAVAREPLLAGQVYEGLTAADAVPRGHKIALAPIRAGAPVLKYAQVIGIASEDIPAAFEGIVTA